MNIVKITDKVFFEREEFASVQAEIVQEYNSPSISNGYMTKTFDGSIITLKNGRKIAIDGVSPLQIIAILENK